MSFLSDYGLFFLETLTLVIAILLTLAGVLALTSKEKNSNELKITPLNKKYKSMKDKMIDAVLDKKALKQYKKEQKSKDKKEDNKKAKPHLFIIDFQGDIKASNVENLREEVTAVLSIATKKDVVMVKIDSGGGTVNSYGLGASQLQRIRHKQIPLVACVDKVAASGGYLMASVANKIIAAPFAIIGSIGVMTQIPNFHKLLKKYDVDIEMLTSGKFKRTLTMLGKNTDEGRKKVNEELEAVHHVFKEHINEHRAQVAIEKVATGEHWLAKDAFSLELVDKLYTSDEYIIDMIDTHEVFQVTKKGKTSVLSKMLKPVANLLNFPHY
jgi:serine protease SohB